MGIVRKKGEKIHFGWFIFAALCLNQFACYQNAYNSLFVLPLANALGVTRSAVLVYMTFFAVTYFFASLVWAHLFQNERIPIRGIMTAGVVSELIALTLFATARALPIVYLAAVFNGIAMTGTKILATTTFSSNWFAASLRGKLMGIISCFQGIAGIFVPIVIQLIIDAAGYRFGYVFLICMVAVFMLPSALFIYYRKPEEKGLKPLGYKEGDQNAAADADLSRGVPFKEAIRSVGFYLIVAVAIMVAVGGGYESNFSGFADEFLTGTEWFQNAAMIAAIMLSIDCVFDFAGNVGIGIVIDRFGVKTAFRWWLALFGLFYVVLLLFHSHPAGLFIAAAFYGFNGSIMRNAVPLLVRDIWGPREHSRIYGTIQSVKGFTSGIASTLIALAYDTAGSYSGTIWLGIVLIALCYVVLHFAFKEIDRYHWMDNPDYAGE